MMMAKYKNPWHKPLQPMYGPRYYETNETPSEYCGYLIYERIVGTCWDVVKDDVCVTQRAGPRGARQAIDAMVSA